MGREGIAAIVQLIRKVSSSTTIIMVEHNLGVVADLSDRITVLQHGGIIFEGTYDSAAKNQNVIEAYLGTGDAELEN
jgi:branched-chain amino acid transport system ATP-binding protein